MRSTSRLSFPLVLCLALLGGPFACTRERPEPPRSTGVAEANPPAQSPATPPAAPLQDPALEKKRAACAAKIRETESKPGLPGAPGFEARRLEILMKAKAEPVLLVDTPEHADAAKLKPSTAVKSFRTLLRTSDHPWDALRRLLRHFKDFPRDGRETLLRDGYLYAEDPDLAFALVNLLGAEHLFGHDEIWIQRGQRTYHAERRRGEYYFTDGPNQGERARLLLLDRIGSGEPQSPPLVRDFRALRNTLHFSEAQIRHITPSQLVADLRYGSLSIPTLLDTDGASVALNCEAIDPEIAADLKQVRGEAKERHHAVQALRQSILLQIEDQLPFDEPRAEFGQQQDGMLRVSWDTAYFRREPEYVFNGDRYKVYSPNGRPRVPQVCVDFITDTFERMSGTWWTGENQAPERKIGKLNFDEVVTEERKELRRVPGFVRYARAHQDRFDVLDIKKSERVPLGERKQLVDQLSKRRADFQPGDILIIRGLTPWDPNKMHYHSFFVYESDPVSGIPLALAGNAGRPSVRYWEVETRRTPKRSIWYRIRPKTSWMLSLLPENSEPFTLVAPVSPLGNAG
jgi:hypothetical protein